MHFIFHIHTKNVINVQDENSSKFTVRGIKNIYFWRMMIILQVSIHGETHTRKMLPKKEIFIASCCENVFLCYKIFGLENIKRTNIHYKTLTI